MYSLSLFFIPSQTYIVPPSLPPSLYTMPMAPTAEGGVTEPQGTALYCVVMGTARAVAVARRARVGDESAAPIGRGSPKTILDGSVKGKGGREEGTKR